MSRSCHDDAAFRAAGNRSASRGEDALSLRTPSADSVSATTHATGTHYDDIPPLRATNASPDIDKESATVSVENDNAIDRDDAKVGGTEATESEDQESRKAGREESRDAEKTRAAADTTSDESEAEENAEALEPAEAKRRQINWSRQLAYTVLPGLALLLTAAAGYLRWDDSSADSSATARAESVTAAKESVIALLSYRPDTVEKDLGSARDKLTGTFRDSYSQLINDVVIPGAKQRHISSVATVPAAASVSASSNHAVALIFVNQTTVVGTDSPTDSASCVRVALDKINRHWLISGFDPV
jgi:Mce-associated membrane protein